MDALSPNEKLSTVPTGTGEQSEQPKKVYTQKMTLAKATKNGARLKAVDAEGNSFGYINLRDHDTPYFYVSKRLLELLSSGGNLPVEFELTLTPTEWLD